MKTTQQPELTKHAILFSGSDCSVIESEESWQSIDVLQPPTGRASAASVVIGDYLWVAGGYSFGNKADFLIRYWFTKCDFRTLNSYP